MIGGLWRSAGAVHTGSARTSLRDLGCEPSPTAPPLSGGPARLALGSWKYLQFPQGPAGPPGPQVVLGWDTPWMEREARACAWDEAVVPEVRPSS